MSLWWKVFEGREIVDLGERIRFEGLFVSVDLRFKEFGQEGRGRFE